MTWVDATRPNSSATTLLGNWNRIINASPQPDSSGGVDFCEIISWRANWFVTSSSPIGIRSPRENP